MLLGPADIPTVLLPAGPPEGLSQALAAARCPLCVLAPPGEHGRVVLVVPVHPEEATKACGFVLRP